MRRWLRLFALALSLVTIDRLGHVRGQDKHAALDADILRRVDVMRDELIACNQDIWTFAELGLEEHRSSARLIGVLKKAGFRVKEGVAGMPTAFIAEYGSGSPVIG